MSLRGILFLGSFSVGLVATFFHPAYGIMTYIYEWHNHPPFFWWGDGWPDLRWSFTPAIITLASLFLNYSRMRKLPEINVKPVGWLFMFVLNAWMVSKTVAVFPEASMDKFFELFKVMILFLLMIFIIRDHEYYRMMIWVIIFCVFNFGFTAWEVGSNRDIGVIAPNATEENAISAHVVACLPFFGMYFLREKNRWLKAFIAIAIPFCLNLLILANSRSALIGLGAIGVAAIFLTKGRARFTVIFGIIVGAVVFVNLTNDDFVERQQTTMDYEEEASAMSRFHIRRGGMEMLKDHPFGVGGGAFGALSMSYIPEIHEPKTQHNTYVAVITDWGYIGFFFYMLFLIHITLMTFRIKRMAKRHPSMEIFHFEATALQLALLGISAAGVFHSRQYAEVVYWLGAFICMIYNMANARLEEVKLEALEELGELDGSETSSEMIPNPVPSK